jgi:hypothetical protein
MLYSEGLLGYQNADGGWSYHHGGSWAEPTCYAMLALIASGMGERPEVRRGAQWLARCQRADGGLAPRESVSESTWQTALTLLLPPAILGNGVDRKRAADWVVAQTGAESGWVYRLRLWMLGSKVEDSLQFDGWPWYPGAAAWVAPTAISILALEKYARQAGGSQFNGRIEQGRKFLLARRCRDGGWNHGSTVALGYDTDSYPEATGLALLALHGVQGDEISVGIARGEQHLADCRSSEAVNWLRLGLMAHGREPLVPGPDVESPTHGGTMELAVAALAGAAARGRNLFLES